MNVSKSTLLSRAAALLLLLALGACGSRKEEVPFGLKKDDKTTTKATDPAAGLPPPAADEGADMPLPAGTRSVAVEGATLLVETGELKVVRIFDADGDGDRDALLLSDNAGETHLSFAKHDGAAFGALADLAHTPAGGAPCTVSDPHIDALGKAFYWVHFVRTCEGAVSTQHWLVSREAQPRLRETLEFLPQRSPTEPLLAATFASTDQDKDGHDDVTADLTITVGEAVTHVPLTWFDRTAGLARDSVEPNATLRTLIDTARANTGATIEGARMADAVAATLCSGSRAGARLRLGTTLGLTCDQTLQNQSETVLALALAGQGSLSEALDAWSNLDPASRSAAREAMRTALAAVTDTSDYDMVEGPTFALQPTPPSHLPIVGFEGEDNLLLRGATTLVYNVNDKSSVDAYTTGAAMVKDPSGQRVVIDIVRLCDGYHLVIAKTHEVMEGVLVGKPVSTPLLEAKESPEGTCTPKYPPVVRDDGGYRIVGWAPQGIVAARPGSVRVVSLEANGTASPPSVLGAQTPLPAPLASGLANRAGTFLILPTEFGLFWQSRGPGSQAKLIRPTIWATDVPSEVAVSEDGHRLAFVTGDRVTLLRPRTPTAVER